MPTISRSAAASPGRIEGGNASRLASCPGLPPSLKASPVQHRMPGEALAAPGPGHPCFSPACRAAGERQRQVMLVEGDGSTVRIEANVSAKDGRIDRDMAGLGVRKFRGAERDLGIHSPAGKAENIAEQCDQAEFA